jgi:hypothetical protein
MLQLPLFEPLAPALVAAKRPRPAWEERFWSKVDRSAGPDACWPWRQFRSPKGYGQFWADGKNVRSNRVALELSLGRPPGSRMEACHRCDNPPCCNPAHLFEGSRLDNTIDCKLKGRRVNVRGAAHGQAKLTPEQVAEIRAATGLNREVAARFGVSPSTISLIRRGETWR